MKTLNFYRALSIFTFLFLFSFTVQAQTFCDVDINCPDGDGWQDVKKGVVLLNGGTGSLIRSLKDPCKAYVLTAHHVLPEYDASSSSTNYISNIRLEFGYENSSCNSNDAEKRDFVVGATMVANGTSSIYDFALLELDVNPVNLGYDVYFNGWDATGNAPSSYTNACIMHPAHRPKKISLYENTITSSAAFWYAQTTNFSNPLGMASGSPLLDPSGRIYGPLKGANTLLCSSPSTFIFPKLSNAWVGEGTNAPIYRKLSHWLGDPNDPSLLALDGAYGSAIFSETCFEDGKQTVSYNITNYSGVDLNNNIITKTAPANNTPGYGQSDITISDGDYITFKIGLGSFQVVGLSLSPDEGNNAYNTVDYGLQFTAADNVRKMENGVAGSYLGSKVKENTIMKIGIEDGYVKYYINGFLLDATQLNNPNDELYVDFGQRTVGSQIKDLEIYKNAIELSVYNDDCLEYGKLDLTWLDNSAGISDYVIKRSTVSGSGFTTIATVSQGNTSYTDTGLSDNTVYYYTIALSTAGGEIDSSNEAYAYTKEADDDEIKPNQPTELVAVSSGCTSIDLSWLDNSCNENYFTLYRSLSLVGGYAPLYDANIGVNQTSYTDTDLDPNTAYYYKLFARNPKFSLVSNKANATTAAAGCRVISEQPISQTKLYPNPANSQFTIDFSGDVEFPIQMQLFSVSGQEIMNKELNEYRNSIQIDKLMEGIYFIQLREKDKTEQLKLIIQ